MKITVNGQQVEAYSLLMRKEFALEIITGKKKVEFRSFSDYYVSQFMDTEAIRRNKKSGFIAGDENAEEEFKAIEYIHFHNRNNSWFLDVKINDIGMFCVDTEDIDEYTQNEPAYPDFEEFRADAKEHDKLPPEERPMMFFLAIEKVVATNLR
ncbi:hypothetical protein [Millionella massiliensis]|uniref:hypothetical protein n=1 Tax=Millionella massiliensis TaxID=1871023 RepID=UPI0008D9A2CB|nr:hypothetical protein [Millionella massiliensis]